MGKRHHVFSGRRKGRARLAWFVVLIALGALAYIGYNWYPRLLYPWPHRELITQTAQKYRLDPHLLAAMIRVESRFNPKAVSARGAVGLMQIMPETAAWIQEARGVTPANNRDGGGRAKGNSGAGSAEALRERLVDPRFNVDLGSWYLRALLDEFGQNEAAALAAYNGGRSNVRAWLVQHRWTGSHEDIDSIPFPETREYVRRVVASRAWYERLYGDRAGARADNR